MSKTISLSQDKDAIVDDEEYERLSAHKWCACRHSNTFYAIRTVNKKRLYMHREILNASQGMEIDHRNRNGLDNRGSNLRVCTTQQNHFNRAKFGGTTSRYKGVSWHKPLGKWQVHICHNGQSMYLGYFNDENDAARAYNRKATELFGEFARLNKVENKNASHI